MSATLGKTTLVLGKQIIEAPGTGLSCIRIGNVSGYTLDILLEGAGVHHTLYAATVDVFDIPPGTAWTGNIIINATSDLSNVSSYPGSFAQIDIYGPNERPKGTYPMALFLNTNVGNTVQTSMGGSNNVQNDNNAHNTQFIEATEAGSPQSNVNIDNSGNAWFAEYISGTFTKLFQCINNAVICIKLAALNKTVEILGSLLVDQNIVMKNNITFQIQDAGGTARDVLYVDGANAVDLQAVVAGGAILFKKIDGTNMFGFNATNVTLQYNSAGTMKDILYGNPGAGELYLQGIGGGKVIIKKSDGTSLMSVDNSGNVRCLGSLTQNVTP